MSDLEKRIGGKITEVRKLRKITQAQLAEKIGVSVETISRLERGVSFPSLKTIETIAVSLKVPISTFFEFEKDPSKDKSFERELSKLNALLRTRSEEDIRLTTRILKAVFDNL